MDANRIAGFSFVERIWRLISFKDAKNKVCILSPESKEFELSYVLRGQYKLSFTDCECIVLAKSRNAILLTDDTYLGRVASGEGVKNVYDLKNLLEANMIEGVIKNRGELEDIISNLMEMDSYLFSEDDLMELFSYFP